MIRKRVQLSTGYAAFDGCPSRSGCGNMERLRDKEAFGACS
ncbi:hypothetical protein ACWERY_06790 [Streptomyces sp. NPDC004082]